MDEDVPEDILHLELYPLYGGYWGYRAAPLLETTRKRIVLIARHMVEREQYEEQQSEMESQQRAIESNRRR